MKHTKDNKSQRPSGPTPGPESSASLKSGLASRYQIKRTHGSMGMDVGEGKRPKGHKGEKVGDGYTWG